MKWFRRARKREKQRNDRYRELMARADEVIYKKKLFLNHHFSKEDLATQLGTNRTSLGAAMAYCRRGKWSDYINSFRLRCFMEEVSLRDTGGIKISELAERCGFGSYNALNNSIKKKYGITAAVYRKNLSTSLRAEGRANTATLS